MCMPRQAQRPTQPHTHINTKEYLDTQMPDALGNTLRYMCSHMSPSASGSFPASCWNTASGWVLQVGKDSHLAQTGPCLLCFPTGMKPQGSATPLGQRSWAYVKASACPRVRVGGGVDHGRGACPLQFDLSSSLRSQNLGRRRERQTGDWRGARTTAEEPHLYSTGV